MIDLRETRGVAVARTYSGSDEGWAAVRAELLVEVADTSCVLASASSVIEDTLAFDAASVTA